MSSSCFEADRLFTEDILCSKKINDYLTAIQTALGSAWIQKGYVFIIKQYYGNLSRRHGIHLFRITNSLVIARLMNSKNGMLLSVITNNCYSAHFVGDRYNVSPELSINDEER